MQALPKDKPLDILDFGCDPGRDVHAFKSLGHNPVGLDGSKSFCQMAEKHSDCLVLHQQFLNLKLEENSFDGIFANASMFHIPGRELPRVLEQLHNALRPNGILFTSNQRGGEMQKDGKESAMVIIGKLQLVNPILKKPVLK